jgi:hypothetical protein
MIRSHFGFGYRQAPSTMVSSLILVLTFSTASAFVYQSVSPPPSLLFQTSRGALRRDSSLLQSNKFELGDTEDIFMADSDYGTAVPDNSHQLHTALAERVAALQDGIGKRYVCRTQRGFLNVHREPGDPYDTSNIVNQLVDGQIVTSTSPKQKHGWIQHDAGGWSVTVYGGFVWLEPLSE